MEFYLSIIAVFGCLLCVQTQITSTCNIYEKKCGSTCCSASELCEESQNRCYRASSKVSCSDGLSYCYKPTICCGVMSCCPENSKCCGYNTCCPKNAVCCGLSTCCPAGSTCCGFSNCCGKGSTCEGGFCKSSGISGAFSWYYIFLILIPFVAVCSIIARRRRMRSRMNAATGHMVVAERPGVAQSVNVNTTGYDQPAPIQFGAYSQAPPTYTEVVSTPYVPPTNVTDDVTKASGQLPMEAPPAYGDVVKNDENVTH